jgi:hypothetical protein
MADKYSSAPSNTTQPSGYGTDWPGSHRFDWQGKPDELPKYMKERNDKKPPETKKIETGPAFKNDNPQSLALYGKKTEKTKNNKLEQDNKLEQKDKSTISNTAQKPVRQVHPQHTVTPKITQSETNLPLEREKLEARRPKSPQAADEATRAFKGQNTQPAQGNQTSTHTPPPITRNGFNHNI